MFAILKNRFPDRQQILAVYGVISLVICSWTVLWSFWKLPLPASINDSRIQAVNGCIPERGLDAVIVVDELQDFRDVGWQIRPHF